ncbi:MAG: hypothetical protein D6785_16590, partial [Planctomycetota bacterium]
MKSFLTLMKMQRWQAKNRILGLFRESKLKIFVILFFALALWAGLYYIFWEAFHYIQNFYQFEVRLIESIFTLFF